MMGDAVSFECRPIFRRVAGGEEKALSEVGLGSRGKNAIEAAARPSNTTTVVAFFAGVIVGSPFEIPGLRFIWWEKAKAINDC